MRYLAIALTIVGMAMSTAWAEGKKLNGKEITENLAGSRVYLTTSRGSLMLVDYSKSGGLKAEVEGGYFSDTGKWWVKGDTYCSKWEKIRNGATGCAEISLDGDTLSWVPVGGGPTLSGKLVK